MYKRMLCLCLLLAVLNAVLQSLPKTFGSALAFTFILGGLPVYAAARLKPWLGILVYIAVSVLSSLINISGALFFIFTNGVIGLYLGIMKNLFRSIYLLAACSALIDTAMLFVVHYLLGIGIFNLHSAGTPISQAFLLFPTMYLYCLIYLKLAEAANQFLLACVKLSLR